METKICSFFGHSEIEKTPELISATTNAINKAIEFGCRTFYFGGFGEFDELCYQIVSQIQAENPKLNLERIYCTTQERLVKKIQRNPNYKTYEQIIYLTPSFDGWYKSIYFRNCAMIDNSCYVIFFVQRQENSGAFKALKYATKRKDLTIVNVYNLLQE